MRSGSFSFRSANPWFGFIAATLVTAVAGFVYALARSRLNALVDIGEGSAEEIKSAVLAVNFWRVILYITGALTLILFAWLLGLNRETARRESA